MVQRGRAAGPVTQLVTDGLTSPSSPTPGPALAAAPARPLWPHLTVALGTASQPSPQLPPGMQPPGHGSRLLTVVKVIQTRCKASGGEKNEQSDGGVGVLGCSPRSCTPARPLALPLWAPLPGLLPKQQTRSRPALVSDGPRSWGSRAWLWATGLGSQVVQDVRGRGPRARRRFLCSL